LQRRTQKVKLDESPTKTQARTGAYGIYHVINASHSPSLEPGR
jgi:hypothetical protein